MEEKFTLVLREKDEAYKITKIAFYGDGGFCIFAPYHTAKSGELLKFEADYSQTECYFPIIEEMHYSAEDKVKLSIHPDGFVQFSGVNRNIISGRDQVTGIPKGLGLMSSPLNKPIRSGPTFGGTFWGINKFDKFIQPKSGEKVIEFNESDYYYRNCTLEDWNGYILEGFLFEHNMIPYITNEDSKYFLKLVHFNFEISGTVFNHRILPYYPKDYIVGILVSRVKVSFEPESGFILSSPSQLIEAKKGIALQAIYPAATSIKPRNTLKYEPIKP